MRGIRGTRNNFHHDGSASTWCRVRIATSRERFTDVFEERPRDRILIEANTESEWVARSLTFSSVACHVVMCYTIDSEKVDEFVRAHPERVGTPTKWVGNEKLPDALTLPDRDNNVETIHLTNPATGTYIIQVFASNLLKAPQDFALVVTAENLPPLVSI